MRPVPSALWALSAATRCLDLGDSDSEGLQWSSPRLRALAARAAVQVKHDLKTELLSETSLLGLQVVLYCNQLKGTMSRYRIGLEYFAVWTPRPKR